MSQPRLLLVGIDGAAPALLERWMESGELPAFARLRESGAFGPLQSVPNMMSPAAWTTIATGVNPGKHGIFCFLDRVPGTYRLRRPNATCRAAPAFWRLTSEAGLRTCVLNMPMSYPAEAVNGLQVAGWLTPSPQSEGFTHPPELAPELAARFGEYPLHSDIQRFVARGHLARARERILGNLRKKGEIAEELLARERWDVMAVAFVEIDPAQHYFWHLTDPSHPEHDVALRERVGDVVLAVYQEMDRILGRLVDRLDDLTHVMIVSDHGAGPNCRGALYLPELFEQLGWQKRRGELRYRAARRLLRIAESRLPAPFKHRFAARLARLGGMDGLWELMTGDISWRDTRAYSFLCGGSAEPWINLRGREPEGTVEPGEEYRALCEEVREVLMTATDPGSGRPVIAEVLHREEVYHGPHLARAPDMLIRWREDCEALSGLRCGEARVDRTAAEHYQTGAHRPEGVLLVCGEGIRAGSIATAQAQDIAPNLLHLCGLRVPGYADGRVLTELLAEERARAVLVDEQAELGVREGREIGDEAEEAAVVERLRGLGYL